MVQEGIKKVEANVKKVKKITVMIKINWVVLFIVIPSDQEVEVHT